MTSENPSSSNRRLFLTSTAKAASIAVPVFAIAASASAQEVYEARRKPNLGRKLPELYRNENRRFFHEIQSDENAHVDFIVKTLGSSARPKPTFRNLTANNYNQFLQMSAAFENTGAGAYQGATPLIFDKSILAAAASIAFVEAFHSGYLNTLADTTIVPDGGSFSPALTQEEVVARLSPYIASLNGGPALSFSTTPSAENDLAIVNFALVAEYLEQEFYNINVPRFYP